MCVSHHFILHAQRNAVVSSPFHSASLPPPFAHAPGFFLKKFRGAHCDLNDLPTLDPELYRNLLRLRDHFQQHAPPPSTSASLAPATTHDPTAPTAAAAPSPDLDLGLTFTVADEVAAALGDPGAEVELKPRGRHIPVTADNVREYIHRVAHYK